MDDGEIPDGWATARGVDLFPFVTSGSRGWAKYYSDKGSTFLRIGNVDHNSIKLDLASIQRVQPPPNAEGTRTRVRPGDILVSITADVGMIALIPDGIGEAYVNQHLAIARPVSLVDRKYLAWFLAAADGGQKQFHALQRGATKVGLGLDDIRAVRVPLAPLHEQHRIVERVEALLDQVNKAKDRLDQVKGILKRFRQSVLEQAMQSADDADDTTLETCIDGFEAGRNLKARGTPAKRDEFGVLKISAVTWGEFRPEENKGLFPGDKPKAHEVIRRGDLLITRANTSDLVGAVVLVDRDFPNLMLPDKILRLRVRGERADPGFLLHALRSVRVREHFQANATGTSDSMRNLSQPKIAAAPISLPSLSEQRRIATHLRKLLALADAVEARLAAASARADKLPQAILSKAFKGELVPTEAELAQAEGRSFESAEELLKRVGVTKPAPPAKKRARRGRTSA